jgi:hypothetical protein
MCGLLASQPTTASNLLRHQHGINDMEERDPQILSCGSIAATRECKHLDKRAIPVSAFQLKRSVTTADFYSRENKRSSRDNGLVEGPSQHREYN